MGGKSAGRFSDSYQICQKKWEGISAGRFADYQKLCQQKWGVNLPADIVPVSKFDSRKGGTFAARFPDCQKICQQKGEVTPDDSHSGRLTGCLPELGSKHARRSSDSYLIYQQKWGLVLLADLLNVRKSASRNVGGKSAGRVSDYHQICKQI